MAQYRFPEMKAGQGSIPFSPTLSFQNPLAATASTQPSKTIYVGVNNDLLRRCGGLATYDTADPMNTLDIIDEGALPYIAAGDFDAPRSGAYVKGKYYAFIYKDYTFVHQMKGFGTLDMETGAYTQIAGPQATPTFSQYTGIDPDCEYFSVVYSLAYDNAHDKLYCLYHDIGNYMGAIVNCCLGTVDYNTGEISFIAFLPNFYYNIAIDFFGNIYGMTYKLQNPDDVDSGIVGTWLNKLTVNADNSVTEENWKEVKSESGYTWDAYKIQDMDFDHDDWLIRWNQITNEGATYVAELDPTTGIYSNQRLIGSNATVVGFYAPYSQADSPEAPTHVSDLTFTAAPNGKNEVTLSWTNPTLAWNRTELTELTQVNIYRGEEIIGIVTEGVEKGSQCSFTDSEAELGFSEYKVVACRNEDEEGLPTTIEVFVGYDAPGTVQNVVLTSPDSENAVITWEAPVIGANGGWFDPSTVTYMVTRWPDLVTVATGLTETTYTDTSLTSTQNYSYEVCAVNEAGMGIAAISNTLTLGPALRAPYSCRFTDQNAAVTWTAYDANNDGDTWRYEDHPWYAWISTQYGNRGKDWLFSPNFYLEANHSYLVSFELHITNHTPTPDEYITFACGKGQTPEAMTMVMSTHEHITSQVERDYTYTVIIDESGVYNFGMLAEGDASNYGTYFTAFSITGIVTEDLAATYLSGPAEISATAPSLYTVTVSNKGARMAEGYSVQLVDDEGNLLAETAETPALQPQEEAQIKLRWAPAASLANSNKRIYGRVNYSKDGDNTNDRTDGISVHIGEVSASVWYDMAEKEGWQLTVSQTIPLNFMYKASWSEVIYDASLLDLPAGQYEISKVGYEYEFNTTVEASFETYAGTTTKSGFEVGTDLIGKADLTNVGKTTLDIYGMKGTLNVNFKTPIAWDGVQNIVIALDRRYNSYNDGDVFNNYFLTYETGCTSNFPILHFGHDSGSFDWTGEARTHAFTQVPVTHFYVTDLQSQAIREVVVGSFGYSVAGGELRIVNGEEIHSAVLYNLSGAIVARAQLNGTHASIDVRSLRAGTYLLTVNGRTMKVHF